MLQNQGSFVVHGQYIKDLSFENKNAPASLMVQDQPQINISFDIKVDMVDENTFEVTAITQVKADAKEQNLFLVELTYSGLFSVEASGEEELEKVLLVQCPNYLFPYIRRIVSDVTRDGGFIPLLLQPIDFFGLYQQKKNTVNDNKSENPKPKPKDK